MKLSIFILIILSFSTYASIAQKNKEQNDTIYRVMDVSAEFPGGKSRMEGYIQSRLKSDQSTWNVKEGIIKVEFVVDKDGIVREVNVTQTLDPMFDENFANLFLGMPKWKPAMVKGQPVRSYQTYAMDVQYFMR